MMDATEKSPRQSDQGHPPNAGGDEGTERHCKTCEAFSIMYRSGEPLSAEEFYRIAYNAAILEVKRLTAINVRLEIKIERLRHEERANRVQGGLNRRP